MDQQPNEYALVLAMARYNGTGFTDKEVKQSYQEVARIDEIDEKTDGFIDASLGQCLTAGTLVARKGRYFSPHG